MLYYLVSNNSNGALRLSTWTIISSCVLVFCAININSAVAFVVDGYRHDDSRDYALRASERVFFSISRGMPTANAEDPCRSERT